MKKIYLIILTVFLNVAMFSCTPDTIEGNGPTACCGDGGNLPPPPSQNTGG